MRVRFYDFAFKRDFNGIVPEQKIERKNDKKGVKIKIWVNLEEMARVY